LVKWRNHFYQTLNEHGFIDVRQNKVQKAEPLVHKPSVFDVETTIEKLKRHESPGIDQIPTELIKAGGRAIRSQIHKLINSIWNKEELSKQWKESIIVHIYETVVIIRAYQFCYIYTKFYPTYAVKVNSIWRGNY
jgi:hypothetical protein